MSICTTCGSGLSAGRSFWTTCADCQGGIEYELGEIETMWPRLSDALEPVRGNAAGPRVSGTANRPLPIAAHVLDVIGPLGVPGRLYLRYADLAVARHVQPARRPPGADAAVRLALYGIRKHLPWAVQAVDLGNGYRELRSIAEDLRRVTGGDTDTHRIPCPAELPDKARCTGQLVYDTTAKTARCRTCNTRLDPNEWLRYWVKLGQPDLV